MTTASLFHFCSDSLSDTPNDQWLSEQKQSCHFRESLASPDEVWKMSNRTDKIQHSPFSTETSMLGLATSASLFLKKSKWLWWILEMNRPEQRFFFFFFAIVFVVSAFWTERVRAQTSVPQALRCHELQVMISDGGSARVSSPVQGVEIASAGAQGATC